MGKVEYWLAVEVLLLAVKVVEGRGEEGLVPMATSNPPAMRRRNKTERSW